MKAQRHLAHVRENDCAVGVNSKSDCNGGVQAHHLMRPWSGVRGMGMKAGDENAIPLCATHHSELHHRGDELAFFSESGYSPNYGKALAYGLWLASPYYKEFDK